MVWTQARFISVQALFLVDSVPFLQASAQAFCSFGMVCFAQDLRRIPMDLYSFRYIRYMIHGCVWKCRAPLNPMVLLIIIPFLNGYFIGNIPYFQTNPHPSHNLIHQMDQGFHFKATDGYRLRATGCSQWHSKVTAVTTTPTWISWDVCVHSHLSDPIGTTLTVLEFHS